METAVIVFCLFYFFCFCLQLFVVLSPIVSILRRKNRNLKANLHTQKKTLQSDGKPANNKKKNEKARTDSQGKHERKQNKNKKIDLQFDLFKCLCCESAKYIDLWSMVFISLAFSFLAMAGTWWFEPNKLYLIVSIPILVFVFAASTWLAPSESRWQVCFFFVCANSQFRNCKFLCFGNTHTLYT